LRSVFLDKDPIFHYANRELFGEATPMASHILVGKIKGGELEAAINSETIFALYNYLKYKLMREPSLLGEDAAIDKAKKFVIGLFSPKSWKARGLEKDIILLALNEGSIQDFEDSIKYHGFMSSGGDVFITWDLKHFAKCKNVLTPKRFLEQA